MDSIKILIFVKYILFVVTLKNISVRKVFERVSIKNKNFYKKTIFISSLDIFGLITLKNNLFNIKI